jgi:uncharacterized protein (TIGR00269 family)
MKCRKCGEAAVINMRQHKLALCVDHFTEWVPSRVEKTIIKYKMLTPQDRVLVAVSGGKDSLALWDILLQLGYRADGLYMGLGIDGGFGYSDESQRKCEAFLKSMEPENKGIGESAAQAVSVQESLVPDCRTTDPWFPKLHILSIPDRYGEAIPDVAKRVQRGRGKPCSVCGLIKRHEMNRIAHQLGYSVLATGHNLDDEAAVLFGNTMTWQVGYLARQGPVLPAADGFARKVKPLCRLYEREMAAYCLVRGIDYIYDECPYSFGATSIAHKELLAELERKSPGAKQNFYLSFLKAKKNGFLENDGARSSAMHACEHCGQPTTAPGLCAFCRLWENTDYASDSFTRQRRF